MKTARERFKKFIEDFYLVLVLALRVISREDLELMPKGEKLAKILHIH